jgi:hypothetical protein
MADGKLKDKKQDDGKQFQLSDYEYDYLRAVAVARNDAYNNYQTIISTFLSYLAGTKWGIAKDTLVDFALDDDKKMVRVTPHIEPKSDV